MWTLRIRSPSSESWSSDKSAVRHCADLKTGFHCGTKLNDYQQHSSWRCRRRLSSTKPARSQSSRLFVNRSTGSTWMWLRLIRYCWHPDIFNFHVQVLIVLIFLRNSHMFESNTTNHGRPACSFACLLACLLGSLLACLLVVFIWKKSEWRSDLSRWAVARGLI